MESQNLEPKEENETFTLTDMIKNTNKEILFFSKLEQKNEINHCSYEKGYITQELWACLTCFIEKEELACLCLGCSLKCHQDHELIHLYFKRNFRCDCGNSKFVPPCTLQTEKDYDNPDNIYNHNFKGKYCYCDKEEENEDDVDGNMIQCIICEDWYHQNHLNILENCDEEGDLICKTCLNEKIKFLTNYDKKEFLSTKDKSNVKDELKTPSKDKLESLSNSQSSNRKRKFHEAFPNIKNNENEINKIYKSNDDNSVSYTDLKESNYDLVIKETCKLIQNDEESSDRITLKNDIFVNIEKLSKIICHCIKCLKTYQDNKVEFLTQNFYEDWVNRELIEENLNKETNEESPDNENLISNVENINMFELKQVKDLSMEKQIELSLVMKNFKDKFVEYLNELPEGTELVTDEHMKKFLEKFKMENPFLKTYDS